MEGVVIRNEKRIFHKTEKHLYKYSPKSAGIVSPAASISLRPNGREIESINSQLMIFFSGGVAQSRAGNTQC